MPLEDHPKFAQWQAASERLSLAQAAKERGEGMLSDVSSALVALNRVRDEIGDI